jgi:DNA (cytosine-5)-methyltransferase 1
LVLTVGDLFCGAGGFSEGFRQTAGFEIKWALDNWQPAILTFEKNQGITVIPKNITEFDFKDFEQVDVLIGSPPCVHFSIAKNGGNGNNLEGLELVEKFFEAVNKLNPKYWIMENVPNIRKTLTKFVRDGVFEHAGFKCKIPKIELLNSADFGVPQKRKRVFLGDFPLPEQTHGQKIDEDSEMKILNSMRTVLDYLPHPFSSSETITDPLYGIQIPEPLLTEQSYITYLTEEECFICQKKKEDHSWAGKMCFPDNLDSPSRTVTASNHGCGRHTIVIKDSIPFETYYRTPTLRELACFQSFPITYQFWGNTVGERHRLIGNAVPPLLSFALAKAILKKEGLEQPKEPIIRQLTTDLPSPLQKNSMTRIGKKITMPLKRTFRDHIPGSITNHSKNSCRVDLDNKGVNPCAHPMFWFEDAVPFHHRITHLVKWRTVLYTGYAKTVRKAEISMDTALMLLLNAEQQDLLEVNITDSFVNRLLSSIPHTTPDASTLQAIWAKRWKNVNASPYNLLKTIADIIEEYFPLNSYDWSKRITKAHPVSISPENGIPLRTASQLFACSFVCEVLNCSDIWLRKNWDIHFHNCDWPEINPISSLEPNWKQNVELKKKIQEFRRHRTISQTVPVQ